MGKIYAVFFFDQVSLKPTTGNNFRAGISA